MSIRRGHAPPAAAGDGGGDGGDAPVAGHGGHGADGSNAAAPFTAEWEVDDDGDVPAFRHGGRHRACRGRAAIERGPRGSAGSGDDVTVAGPGRGATIGR